MLPWVLFLPSIRSKAAPGPPSDSSDGDTDGGSAGSRVLQNKRSSAREGLDRELQTFISMRDQTDQATEVGYQDTRAVLDANNMFKGFGNGSGVTSIERGAR